MSDEVSANNGEQHSQSATSAKDVPKADTHDPESKAGVKAKDVVEETRNDDTASMADARDDSEAETVVLPGKEDGPSSPHGKVIKHEGKAVSQPTIAEPASTARAGKLSSNSSATSQDKKSGKELTATSSNLSSAKSSPAPDTAPSPAASETAFSKSSNNEGEGEYGLLLRKRKNQSDDHGEKSHKRRQRRDVSQESRANTAGSDVDQRNARELSSVRPDSPQPRTRTRALSVKSSIVQAQKRRKPPPLQVGSRTRASADVDEGSEDSDRQPRPQKFPRLASTENSAMSPAKPPYRKRKDKSGRTWLARACDAGDVEGVKQWLDETPEDLNTMDNANNTPLQIAALSGRDEIVKLLLEASCDIDCKNVDQDTPLIDAVENGHLEVIKLLLDAGMDPGQTNQKGEQLLDLLDTEAENYETIRDILVKTKSQRRRTSEDHNNSRTSAPARSPRESAHPSPPPTSSTSSRRRAARKETTRNDLLYVNPTPENLREKAKVGDDEAVGHILNMRPIADIPAVIAAARGGHENSLELLIAIGKPEQDPDPSPYVAAHSATPMLAAIGRKSIRIVELLLSQPGFNPTRRLYKGLTYPELAKERGGANWEAEYKLLKRAFDNHKAKHPNTSSPSSKRDSQAHRELKKSRSEGNTTAANSKRSSPEVTKEPLARKKSSLDSKSSSQRRDQDRDSEKNSDGKRKHLRVPTNSASREQSTAVSDREVSPVGVPVEKVRRHKRSLSDTENQEREMPKPARKRLISGRALKNDEEKKRRASLASVASSSSQEAAKQKDSPKSQIKKIKREDSKESSKMNNLEPARKRSRPSPSPSDGKSPTLRRSSPELKKTKRLRLDSEGKPVKRKEGNAESVKRDSPQPPARTSSQTAAPVAPMAGSTFESKEVALKLPDLSKETSKADFRKANSTQSSPKISPKASPGSNLVSKRDQRSDEKQQEETSKQLQAEMQASAQLEALQRKEQELKDKEQKEKEQRDKEQQEKEQQAKELVEQQERERIAREEAAAKAEAERVAQEQEAARKEAQRLADEAERKAKAEREAEEARQEQKRQEEEQARKVAERERQRKEDEERQARRRAEQEERERVARLKKREDDERRRREALPNALRILAEMTPAQAKQEAEIRRWLPLLTVKSSQLDITDSQASDEVWVPNLQVAPILGLTDLDLSQYTAWTKRPATKAERASLWKVLRVKLIRYEPHPWDPYDYKLAKQMHDETHEKFNALARMFWIRLSDLQDIVPRYPHLTGIKLGTQRMEISRPDDENTSPLANGHHSPQTNGDTTTHNLTNGYH